MQTSKTFSIHFWLSMAKKKDGFAPVYARIIVNSERIELSLQRRIMLDLCDGGKSRLRGSDLLPYLGTGHN